LQELIENLKDFNSQEISIDFFVDEARISAKDSASAFTKAQGIFNQAPYILKYEDKEWISSSLQISKWFIFQEGFENQVNLFLDQEKLKLYLEEIAQELDIAPIETRLKLEGDGLEKKVTEFQAGQSGMILNIEASKNLVTRNILFGEEKETNGLECVHAAERGDYEFIKNIVS